MNVSASIDGTNSVNIVGFSQDGPYTYLLYVDGSDVLRLDRQYTVGNTITVSATSLATSAGVVP